MSLDDDMRNAMSNAVRQPHRAIVLVVKRQGSPRGRYFARWTDRGRRALIAWSLPGARLYNTWDPVVLGRDRRRLEERGWVVSFAILDVWADA